MRIGTHPGKEGGPLQDFGRHRLIVPVHIPHTDGYFAQSRRILERCLESIRLSAAGRVAVTLVADGSSAEVVDDLRACQARGWVDQLVVNDPNRGKVDSVVGALRSSFEPLVTICDADVLFRAGWVDAVEEIFSTFPECGFASLFPSPPGAFHLTSATLLAALSRREVSVAPVGDTGDLDRFASSIDRPDLFPPRYRRAQFVVRRDGVEAVIGAPHWVLTLRRAVVRAIPAEPSRRAVGDSETRWLDEPADRLGLWRLSTARAYAQHMGNVIEPWMDDELDALRLAGREEPAPRTGAGSTSDWAGGTVRLAARLPWRLRLRACETLVRPWLERRLDRVDGPR